MSVNQNQFRDRLWFGILVSSLAISFETLSRIRSEDKSYN